MVLTVCIAIILCRPHYGNAVTSDNVTKWRRDIMWPQEILRPGTKHWRLCALRQSGGVSLCVLRNGTEHCISPHYQLWQSGGATLILTLILILRPNTGDPEHYNKVVALPNVTTGDIALAKVAESLMWPTTKHVVMIGADTEDTWHCWHQPWEGAAAPALLPRRIQLPDPSLGALRSWITTGY